MSLAAPDVLAELGALRVLTAQLQSELYAKNLYIERLKAQLASLKRTRFGRSSEKLDHLIEQLELAIVDLDRSTLAGWVGAVAALLQVLSDRIGPHARAGETVHADDTPFQCLI